MGTWGLDAFDNDAAADFHRAITDRIEAAFATLAEALADDTPEGRIVRFRELQRARAAVVMLTSWMRDGIDWTPSADCVEPEALRRAILGPLETASSADDPAAAALVQAIARELDEFVALAKRRGGIRRPLPAEGTLERRFREQRAKRELCEWAHGFGGDTLAAWRKCPIAWLADFARVLGLGPDAVLRAYCGALLAVAREVESEEPALLALALRVLEDGASRGHAGLREHAAAYAGLRARADELNTQRRAVLASLGYDKPPGEPAVLSLVFPCLGLVEIGRAELEGSLPRIGHLLGSAKTTFLALGRPGEVEEIRRRLEPPQLLEALRSAAP
jgi:hypothetical protein